MVQPEGSRQDKWTPPTSDSPEVPLGVDRATSGPEEGGSGAQHVQHMVDQSITDPPSHPQDIRSNQQSARGPPNPRHTSRLLPVSSHVHVRTADVWVATASFAAAALAGFAAGHWTMADRRDDNPFQRSSPAAALFGSTPGFTWLHVLATHVPLAAAVGGGILAGAARAASMQRTATRDGNPQTAT